MTERIDTKSHKIMSMDSEKRERVINASISEFCNGFKNASTDAIIREAGISKGLLYHYFGTKEELYRFMLWYSFDTVITEYSSLLNTSRGDLLDRLWQTILLKIDLSYKYPAIFEFLAAAYRSANDDPPDEFAGMFKSMRDSLMSRMFENIDASLFKEGVDIEKAAKIIWWSLQGYSETIVTSAKRLEDYQREYGKYLAEVESYLNIFRVAFYK